MYRRKRRKIILFAVLAIFALIFVFKFFFRVNKAVRSVAEAKLRLLTTEALNSAILSTLEEGVSYSDLVTVERAGDKILSVSSNSLKINKIAREAVSLAQKNISGIGDKIYIPIGAFSGLDAFYGSGPEIGVKILPVGKADCAFSSTFTEAGINQTKHSIYLRLNAEISVVMLKSDIEFSLSAEVLISECVLMGEVPGVYIGSDIFN